MFLNFLLVGLGGAIGSMLRFGAGILSLKFLGVSFPWGTLTVNIIGSFCIGLLFAILPKFPNLSEDIKIFAMIGILGGFTTFSAFSLDTILMLERGQYLQVFLYVAGSIFLSIAATFIGLALIRATS